MFVAFTAFVAFLRRPGWSFYFIYLAILFVAWRVAFMVHWCGTLVAFTVLVVFTGHWGWTFMVFFSVCSV